MTGSSVFFKDSMNIEPVLAFLNSKICSYLTNITNPTVALQIKNVRDLPIAFSMNAAVADNARRCVALSKLDYCAYETALEFSVLPIRQISLDTSASTIKSSYIAWIDQNREAISEMKRLEEESNRFFIEVYALAGEITPDVSSEKITLTVNPAYRYGGKLTEMEQWTRFRQDTVAELISYAVGCMMGRYSLDEPGLIYAHGGNVGFDPSRFEKRFPADADGIVPITDGRWFNDDAGSRVREFLRAVWGANTIEENMVWLAESLGAKGSETSDETIRRYLTDKFFKHHLQTYKKRPIYWLFSSGKQGAFQALVYLHRYNEGTLARMRAEYVVPLITKVVARLDLLDKDVAAASSAATRTKLQKQIESLRKKQIELLAYDEKLRHYADMRITLDLDDGVKVNYAKFGDLLDSVKLVTGGAGDD